jgi:uncharacterized protein (DUF58 family)
MAQLASALALVAHYGKDKVGLLIFSDQVDLFIPPSRGQAHIHRIMEKLFSHKPSAKKTNIKQALEHVAKLKQYNAMVFLISDFIDTGFERNLRIIAKKYELIAVRFLDTNEQLFPAVGFVEVEDIETGQNYMFDMRRSCSKVNGFLHDRLAEQNMLFKKSGIDLLEIAHDRPFISDVIYFFRRRMMY